jgi:hypothetical protein
MCTYETVNVAVTGSAKGPQGWTKVTRATVYFDHPVHAQAEHTLNVDIANPELGPSARVGLELDPTAARALAGAILEILDAVPAVLVTEQAASSSHGRHRAAT